MKHQKQHSDPKVRSKQLLLVSAFFKDRAANSISSF